MDSNNIIFFFILTLVTFFFYKYFLYFTSNYSPKLLIDDNLSKPQAFHTYPVSIAGGLGIFFAFTLTTLYLFFFKQIVYYEYITFCLVFFLLGLADDLKISIRPKFRLLIMVFSLIALVIYNELYIERTGIEFLNNFLEIDIFALFFICLCFLFIINGSNLIDGFNGLLGIHSLIILINLFIINYFNENYDLALILFIGILSLIIFLVFNFPKAKILLGDSGSYFLGTFIALSVIKTSLANPTISPFYFCILLFYLFFEVFFSFIRKIVSEKTSPLFPDKKHLHMLIFKIFLKRNNDKVKSNYSTAATINLVYLLLIIPPIFFTDNGMFCKYYSILFFIIYIFSYKIAQKKT